FGTWAFLDGIPPLKEWAIIDAPIRELAVGNLTRLEQSLPENVQTPGWRCRATVRLGLRSSTAPPIEDPRSRFASNSRRFSLSISTDPLQAEAVQSVINQGPVLTEEFEILTEQPAQS
ncbi:MAG: hypothetical protein O2960_15590, partial [Verrucomicrobia bacterium]|nr:hypothetical protein [Verrucomicrobiota bacterium]